MTRGRGCTSSEPSPDAASRAICTGPTLVPWGSSRSPCGHVVAAAAQRVPGLDRAAEPGHLCAAVGPLDRDHGVRASRQQRAGHDPQAAARLDPVGAGVAGCDLARHRQLDRAVLGGAGQVAGVHRVAVHSRVVERGQRGARGHVRGEYAALGLGQRDQDRGHRVDGGQHLGQVILDGGQVLVAVIVPAAPVLPVVGMLVPWARGGHRRLSRYLRSQGTNSAATSGRSQANWTRVRR